MLFKKKKIAIVGMACRLPGGIESPDDYWQVLKNSEDVVTSIDPKRWGTDYYQHPDKKEPGKSYTFAAGVLSQVDQFDAGFFGISPREAAQMDPQQRLLLELTWEALENGGQLPEDLAGSQCAVYVGIASTDYAHRRMDDLCSLDPYSMTGNTASIASNRISYLFDLHGPSVSVDTACSSSLVALHQACNSIWSGDAPMAIAGGVNMLLHPFGFVGFSKASMLSPNGRCKAFDDSGDGYVRSEGSGVLFLKPLDEAIAAGDPIQAVILESGINCDGQTNGISLPSADGQSALLQDVYSNAGINPDKICYIEAHGTGTAVGDPIETSAISKVLAKPRKKPLRIGSAKTNLGHLETASGMAGIFKIIMSLKNRAIPESLHFKTPNKNIDFKASNLEVVDKFTPLPKSNHPLLMGVNSFGFGGANAHILLEEYKPGKTAELHSIQKPAVPPLFLSAESDNALQAMAQQYGNLLEATHSEADYYDIAYSTANYRQQLKIGLAVNGKNHGDIKDKLLQYVDGKKTAGIATTQKLGDHQKRESAPKLALVFSGNGSQWQGMGCQLLETEPVFRTAVEEINALLATHCKEPISLIEEFQRSAEESKLEYTEIAQLLLFSLQVGIIKVLRAHGLRADATLGHSVGEVSAAWAAGALTLEQAVFVIYERSHAQGETKGSGRMAAAGLGQAEMTDLLTALKLHKSITIAGINSPTSVTLSGALTQLEQLTDILDEKSIFYRILDLDYAFHSPKMLPIEQRIKSTLYGLDPQAHQIRFVSTVTGSDLAGEKLDATYWWENIRQPVLFGKAMDTLIDDGFEVFLEIGPHPILRTYISECCRAKDITGLPVATQTRKTESVSALLDGLYTSYLAGCHLDLSHIFPKKGNFVQLPNYPWQREKHWYALTTEGSDLVNRKIEHPLLGYRLKSSTAQWENHLDIKKLPYLQDHVVDGGVIFPAAGYVEMALAASALFVQPGQEKPTQPRSHEIENIEIKAPIVLDTTKITRFTLLPSDGSFTIESKDRLSDSPWTLNVVGRLLGTTNRKTPAKLDTVAIAREANLQVTSIGHYKLTESVGLSYGPGFQGVAEVWVSPLTALARLTTPVTIETDYDQYHLHPSLLDAGFQVLVDVFADDIANGKVAALIPVQIGKLYYYQQKQAKNSASQSPNQNPNQNDQITYLQVNIRKQSPQSVVADFSLLNDDGVVLVELHACRFKGVQFAHSRSVDPATYEFSRLLMPQRHKQTSSPEFKPHHLATEAHAFLASQETRLNRQQHYQHVLPLFDVIMTMYAWQAVSCLLANDSLQTDGSRKNTFTIDDLIENSQLSNQYRPLLTRLMQLLEADELANYEKKGKWGTWSLAENTDLPNAEDIWLSILGDSPAYLPELMLLGRCGSHLTEVLQGSKNPNALLFPKKSSVQEHLNHASQSYTAMNLALCEIVRQVVNSWPNNRRLRILEMGGGDAGLTRQLLPILPADQCDYLFTDATEDHVSKAAMEFNDCVFLTTRVLDIEQNPAQLTSTDEEHHQGDIDLQGYDLIIAGNTLYQADNLHKVLTHTHQLLAPNGMLLLLERQPDAFTDFTLGLDPHWWDHTTDEEHPLSLLLNLNEWENSLKKANFKQLTPLLEPEAVGDEGAFILMATASGNSQSSVDKSVVISNAVDVSTNTALTNGVDCVHSWMIITDQTGLSRTLGKQLVQLLAERQQHVVLVETASQFNVINSTHLQINIKDPDAFEPVFTTLREANIHCHHVVQLAGLRKATKNGQTNPLALQSQRCISTTDLVQGIEADISQRGSETIPQLWLVTSDYRNQPDQAPLWGLGRVIMNEHPDLNCKLIDLNLTNKGKTTTVNVAAALLLTELLDEKSDENEIVLGEDSRHVLRMQRVSLDKKEENSADKKSETKTVGLSFKTPGPLKNLYWQALPTKQLAPDEIEIKPYATGLNFRDVMYAMGMLSDEAVENGFAGPTLGMELSGKVINVGKDITDYKTGDDVIGFAPACFSNRVITQTTAIAHKPKAWSYNEAATVPTTFFTVYYALHHLAQIRSGDKILIHGAAGGVGIAAIQFARYRGAEIFATAGTDEKREFVRLMGADHVLDSRSLAFADDIMEITDGSGIDIVLNSLAGEAINRNLSILKPFGRFLELGKRDFYENSKIGLRPFRNNISYFGIDADQLLIERADLAAELFKEMMDLFAEGVLRPLPHRVFPANQIEAAFRYMQQSQQIGKVVVSFQEEDITAQAEHESQPQDRLVCDPTASYLVTGGLTGFGLATAHWLADKGAQSLVLASRSGKPTDESLASLEALKEKGVTVSLRACDIADKQAVAVLFKEFGHDLPPLKGLVHAAMVIDDGLISNMSHEQFNNVLSPKIAGAWNLHNATTIDNKLEDNQLADSQLDFFVMYSSATTYLGNPGQANYVAGNAFLESLARYRKSKGLTATYAAWGAIDDVGFLARNEEIKEALQSRLGGIALSSAQALHMLEKLILSDKAGAAVIDFDWNVIQRIMPGARSPKYAEQQRQVKHTDSDSSEDIQTLIANKKPDEIQEIIIGLLLTEIEHILRLPREKLDTNASVFDLGMDSLMGMELVLAIEERFHVKLPVMALTEGATIERIAERISSQLLTPTDSTPAAPQQSKHEEAVAIAATRHAKDVNQDELDRISAALDKESSKESSKEGTNG